MIVYYYYGLAKAIIMSVCKRFLSSGFYKFLFGKQAVERYNYIYRCNTVTITFYLAICIFLILRFFPKFEYRNVLINLSPVIYISLILKFGILMAIIFKENVLPSDFRFFKLIAFSEQVFFATLLILMVCFFIESFSIEISRKTYFFGLLFIILDLVISEAAVQEFVMILGWFAGLSALYILNIACLINISFFTVFFIIISILRGIKYGFGSLFRYTKSKFEKRPDKNVHMIDF